MDKPKRLEELEKVILDQIEKLNDDSLFEDPAEAKIAIEKSRSIAELTGSLAELENLRIAENRLKLDAVKIAMSADGYGYKKYLGIEEDTDTKKP